MRQTWYFFASLVLALFLTMGWIVQTAGAAPPESKQLVSDQNQLTPKKKTKWYKTRTAKITAGGAGAGALVGGLAGGRKGTAIGALTGAGAGYVYDRATKNKNKKQ